MTTSPPSTTDDAVLQEPIQQHAEEKTDRFAFIKKFQPVWMTQLPTPNLQKKPDKTFQLVNDDMLEKIQRLYQLNTESIDSIKSDRAFMETELLRYFRELDSDAKVKQNSFRLYQIRILMLASAATLVGSLQAVSVDNQGALQAFGMLEALIALFTVFIIQTRGDDASLPSWLNSRKKAEQLRREYFRFMLRLPPYDINQKPYDLKLKLSRRAAEIYNDQDPEEPSILEGDSA